MSFFRVVSDDQAEGEWVEIGRKRMPDGTERKLEVCVRPLPTGLLNELYARHVGRKQRGLVKGRGVETTFHGDKLRRYTREVAIRALIDTRGLSLELVDAGAAKRYGELLGRELEPHTEVVLDGHLEAAVKDAVFRDVPALAERVSKESRKLTGALEEDEEGKDDD